MSVEQERTGSVDVELDSNVITGNDTSWLTTLSAGNIFKLDVDGAPVYRIASVDSDTQMTLELPYIGDTASAQAYMIQRSFTLNHQLERPFQGDADLADTMRRVIDHVDALLNLGTVDGLFQLDEYGNLVPITGVIPDDYFELDSSNNIIPKL